jgi:membrane associated rhomboid family serine protease
MIPLRDTIPSQRLPVVTISLIGANVLVFLWQLSLSDAQLQHFFASWGVVPRRFTNPRLQANYWTLLSSMFLHGGWMHIIGNMWSLWIFGDNVEDRLGRGWFLGFYVLSGLAAGVLHIVTNPLSRIPTVGASGAIAGVMGAYILLFPHATVLTLVPIFIFMEVVELPAILFLGIWFLSNLLSGLGSLSAPSNAGGVAWWAHIGGFLVGLLWAWGVRQRTRLRRRSYYDDDEYARWP